MNRTLHHRLPVVTAFAATSLLAANLAFAAWSSTGTGSGTAMSTTSANSVINANTYNADLFPGAIRSVTVVISNPNSYPVKVTSISAGTSNAVGDPACPAGSVKSDAVTAPDPTPIGPGDWGTYTITTRMINDASDNCKSKTFSLPLNATLVSVADTAGH